MDDPLVTDDARGLVADLTARGQTVATAESLTAGLLAATARRGAGRQRRAAWRAGDLHRRDEDRAGGRGPELLDDVGPVAEATARALAVGAQQRCGATWGVGLTGVAGPEPHGGYPVGTVFLGVAGPVHAGPGTTVRLALEGTRWDIRLAAVHAAISRLRLLIAQN